MTSNGISDFDKSLRAAERLVADDGDGVRLTLRFDPKKDGDGPQALLILKALRLLGEQRPCLVTYDPKDDLKVQMLRRSAKGAILNAPGTAVLATDEYSSADLDSKPFWRSIGTFNTSILGFLGEDMFIDEAHDFKDIMGLKQLCDAAELCDMPLSVTGKVRGMLRQSPDLYFLSRFVSVQLPQDASLAIGNVPQKERHEIAALMKEVRGLLHGKRVLIVEDDPLWAGALSEVCHGAPRKALAQVIARGTDKQILDEVSARMTTTGPPLALCIIDARLRRSSGNRNTWRKVVEIIRRTDKGVPILVLSVSRRPEDGMATKQIDADYLFQKDLGITPWEKLSIGEVGLRSVRHLKGLLSVIKLMCTGDMALVNKWSDALRNRSASDEHWWTGHSFACMQQDPKTQAVDQERLEVSLHREEVVSTFEESLARSRRLALHEAMLAMSTEGKFRPDPVDRANAVLGLGRLIERVHSKDPFGASNIVTHHLGRYVAYRKDSGEGIWCGREDHLAEQLYRMRHAAAHFSGMTATSDADWRAFFAGMFVWLLGTGNVFPLVPQPSVAIEGRKWNPKPWYANRQTPMRDRLAGMLAHDRSLKLLYQHLVTE